MMRCDTSGYVYSLSCLICKFYVTNVCLIIHTIDIPIYKKVQYSTLEIIIIVNVYIDIAIETI